MKNAGGKTWLAHPTSNQGDAGPVRTHSIICFSFKMDQLVVRCLAISTLKYIYIYIYIYIIVIENEDGQLRAKENIYSKNSENDKKFNKKRFGL